MAQSGGEPTRLSGVGSTNRIFGCWYSDNSAPERTLAASLASVERAVASARHSRPEVATCVWRSISRNPFPELIAYYQQRTHLNIVTQILRIIASWAPIADMSDVVCFLEHDVLYPEDYFDRVSQAFSASDSLRGTVNLDYIGLNQSGWLEAQHRHEPLHQISVRYRHARRHFRAMLFRLVTEPVLALEPPTDGFTRIPYRGERPSCHINHPNTFTSHFRIYESDAGGRKYHPYWGNAAEYFD